MLHCIEKNIPSPYGDIRISWDEITCFNTKVQALIAFAALYCTVSTVPGVKSRRFVAQNEERDRKHTAACIADSNTSADIYDTTMGSHITYVDLESFYAKAVNQCPFPEIPIDPVLQQQQPT
jgi:hypothetical protein